MEHQLNAALATIRLDAEAISAECAGRTDEKSSACMKAAVRIEETLDGIQPLMDTEVPYGVDVSKPSDDRTSNGPSRHVRSIHHKTNAHGEKQELVARTLQRQAAARQRTQAAKRSKYSRNRKVRK